MRANSKLMDYFLVVGLDERHILEERDTYLDVLRNGIMQSRDF